MFVQVMLWFEDVQNKCFGWPSTAMQVSMHGCVCAWVCRNVCYLRMIPLSHEKVYVVLVFDLGIGN